MHCWKIRSVSSQCETHTTFLFGTVLLAYRSSLLLTSWSWFFVFNPNRFIICRSFSLYSRIKRRCNMLAHLYNVILYSFHSREQVPNELLQLVSRRHSISSATQDMNDLTTMRPHLLTLNGMLKLQEDIVSRYLTGRPRIANISSIHIPFVFRASKPTSEAHPLKYVYCSNLFDLVLLPFN